ncbi:MAG: hypothetical protein HS122_10765 [Opitutaceae bacterium]|nr:hypothetical protein [Opitutaceae bacterium]
MISLFQFHFSLFCSSPLVAELRALFVSPLSLWERSGEGACMSAKLEAAIRANLKGLGFQ